MLFGVAKFAKLAASCISCDDVSEAVVTAGAMEGVFSMIASSKH